MKKLIKIISLLLLFIPSVTFAANFAAPWISTTTTQGNIFPAQINGIYFPIVVPYVSASSTTASSTFANGINLTGGCFALNGTCITVGGGAVSSVSNIDGSLTISPTTGSIIASLNVGNANTWTGIQTFTNGFVNNATSTGSKGFNISAGCFAINNVCVGTGSGTGTVTSVSGSGGSTGLTLTGGPITTTGTLTLGGTLGIANGGTNATTNAAAGRTVGTYAFTDHGLGQNNYTLETPAYRGQIGMNQFGVFPQQVYLSNGTSIGNFNSAWQFPGSIVRSGSDPDASSNAMPAGINITNFTVNGNYADRLKQGDGMVVSQNDSASAFSSGSSFCVAIMKVINGTSTNTTSNSSCFLNVLNNAVGGIDPGMSLMVFNKNAQTNRGFGIGGPGMSGFGGDPSNYMIQLNDFTNTLFRIPFDRQYVWQPLDKVYRFTVSGITVTPSFLNAVYKDNNGIQWTVDTNNVVAGSGTIDMTGTTTPPTSGNLTLVELGGATTGDATIAYSSTQLLRTYLDTATFNPISGVSTLGTTTINNTFTLTGAATGCAQFTSGVLSSTGTACGSSGGGSGGGTWSTTTSSVSGTLINYPNNNTDVVTIGSTATSSASFFLDPVKKQFNVANGSYITQNSGQVGGQPGSTNIVVASTTALNYFFAGAGPADPTVLSTTYVGNSNIAIGPLAFKTATSSSNNVVIGINAMANYRGAIDNGAGGQMTVVGAGACLGDATNFKGTAVDCYGYNAGLNLRNGNFDNISGRLSGQTLRDANFDMCYGSGSCANMRDASHDTMIGQSTGLVNTTLQDSASYASAIGNDSVVGCSNCMVLGVIPYVTAGQGQKIGIGTTTPFALLSLQGNSGFYQDALFSISSSTSSFATTTAFIVKANGNIGIGTSTPYAPLSVVGLGGVVASQYTATSTTATSTFAGGVMIGNSLFNGQFAPTGFFNTNGYPQLQISANVSDGLGLLTVGNTDMSPFGAGCMTFANGRTPNSGGAASTYNANICFQGPNFAAYPGAPGNSLAIDNTDGIIVTAALSPNWASSTIPWAVGPGFTSANYDMQLSNLNPALYPNAVGSAVLSLGSTTPYSDFTIVASSTKGIPFFTIASSTNGSNSTAGSVAQQSVFDIQSNGNVGIASSTPGTSLAVGNNINLSSTATSTFQLGGINLTKGCYAINGTCIGSGSSSGTVTSVQISTPNASLSLGGTNPVTTSGVISADLNMFNTNTWSVTQAFNGGLSANGGLTAYATSTIGDGSVTGGLTISGTATSTNLIVKNNATVNNKEFVTNAIGVGTLSPTAMIHAIVTATSPQTPFLVDNEQNSRGTYTIGTEVPSGTRVMSIYRTSSNLVYENVTGSTNFYNTAAGNIFQFSNATQGSQNDILTIGGTAKPLVGVGTTSPYAALSVQSNQSTGDAFVVATSTKNTIGGYDNDGHRFTSGPAPAISSCGTGTGTVVGDDQSGTVTTATAATACTVTFAKAYQAAPTCNVTDDSLVGFADVSSVSTSAITFGISSALTGGHLYYSCQYHR